MSSYPKWLYHATNGACIVPDEAAHKAAGDEWAESPGEAEALARKRDDIVLPSAEPEKPAPKPRKGK